MDTIIDFIDEAGKYGFNFWLLVAGGAGAFVKMGKKEELTFGQQFFTVISGGLIANYLTPSVFHFINVPQDMQFGFAFLFGWGGLESVKWTMFKLKDKYDKDKK